MGYIDDSLADNEVLADRVEDTPENETRFVWLEKSSSRPKPPDLLTDRAS